VLSSDRTVRVDRIELEQFRVYRDFAIDIPPAGLRIAGPNGAGKTTLLEAIELLSTTRPRRGSNDADLINHESGIDIGVPPYARVVASVHRDDLLVRLEIFLQRGQGRSPSKKVLKVADRPRRAGDVVGLVPTVTFAPDDLDLVVGSPSVRRRFLDILLSQIDRKYLRCLSRYARILSQRNGLLKQVAESGGNGADQFAYWDEQLVALGSYLVAARVIVVAALAREACATFAQLSPGTGTLGITYQPTVTQPDAWWRALAEESSDTTETAQRIGVVFEQQLRQNRALELSRGSTLIGPHRDDLAITLEGRDLTRFGSRGQQRMAVLALKLAEVRTATSAIGAQPILLLDDVLSELDARHQALLLEALQLRKGQVFVTATAPELIQSSALADLGTLRLAGPGLMESFR
jgi:DNA replication and repair protein RecF